MSVIRAALIFSIILIIMLSAKLNQVQNKNNELFDAMVTLDYLYKDCMSRNEALKGIMHGNTKLVDATVYHPVPEQTDDDPHILADGTIIDIYRAGEYRYLAMSRDLLKRWNGNFDYGDHVLVLNAGEHSGLWQVKDTMNPRFNNRIDFLLNPGDPINKYENVIVFKIEK